ncbi:MAG: DUF3667 domain-containing protein [Bacteroidota bacterium]
MSETASSYQQCLNCEQPLTADAKYCHGCGQKVTDGRVTMKELFREFLDSVFNIDTKFFRTIGNLFAPGKLTIEYFSGKHKSFLQPIRLFLIMTILLIASISYLLRNSNFNPGNVQHKWREQQHIHEMLLAADTIREKTAKEFKAPVAKQAIDSFYQNILVYDDNYSDTIKLPITVTDIRMRFAREDYNQLTDNELIEKYFPDESFMQKLMLKQGVRFTKSDENIITFLLDKITWLVLLILPVFAFALRLLYIRRDFYYVEHLIFSVHLHTFLFLWGIFAVLTSNLLHEALIASSTLTLPIYIIIAMRRFYQQSWWKTIAKFCLAFVSYWFILMFGVMIMAIVSFLLF